MNLRQLEAFCAVMMAGSVTNAAQSLHLSQPAVSGIISAALAMIPLTLDEVEAMTRYMARSMRAGNRCFAPFFQGRTRPGDSEKGRTEAPRHMPGQLVAATWGVTLPWSLPATCVLGAVLTFPPLLFDASGPLRTAIISSAYCSLTVAGVAHRLSREVLALPHATPCAGSGIAAAPHTQRIS